jgi:hypothetical protein
LGRREASFLVSLLMAFEDKKESGVWRGLLEVKLKLIGT